MTGRVDQTIRSLEPLNPLDLDLRDDVEWYTPNTIWKRPWTLNNDEISSAPTMRDIAVLREDWESFLEGFDTEQELEDQTFSEDQMDTIYDPEQFYYPLEEYGYTPDTYTKSMLDYIEESENDEFERFLPDDIGYGDPLDFLSDIDE